MPSTGCVQHEMQFVSGIELHFYSGYFELISAYLCMCVCVLANVYLCVYEREKERERARESKRESDRQRQSERVR